MACFAAQNQPRGNFCAGIGRSDEHGTTPDPRRTYILQPEWPADKVERRAVAALIPFQAAPIVILTMRAFIVMSLCTAMVAESAFAKQRFNPTKCSQTAYSACLHDVGPYCRKEAASEPAATRAVEHTACLARYQSTCREIHCD